jgi:hypothetical protein
MPQTQQESAILLLGSTSTAIHAAPFVASLLLLPSRHNGEAFVAPSFQRQQQATDLTSERNPPAGVDLLGRSRRPFVDSLLLLLLRHNERGPSRTDRQGQRPPPCAANLSAPSVLPPSLFSSNLMESGRIKSIAFQNTILEIRWVWKSTKDFLVGRSNHLVQDEQIGKSSLPARNSQVIANLNMCKLARSHLPVALSNFLLSPIFFGYTWRFCGRRRLKKEQDNRVPRAHSAFRARGP